MKLNTSKMRFVKAPKKAWEFIGLDTTTYSIDVEVYKTETGEFVLVDVDWMLGF
jgi:hypothetical protein